MLGQEIISESKVAMVRLLVKSLLKPADPLRIVKVDGKINIPAKLFSYLLPLVVNRTLFRKSEFITKIIAAMIARRIGKRIGPKVAQRLLNAVRHSLSDRKPKNSRIAGHSIEIHD